MLPSSHPRRRRDLVLVGGGHSHVQVLRSFAMEPPPDVRLTVVLDRPLAVYSGMVPGFIAGQYRAAELEIDVVPLARLAGGRVILSAATGVDPENKRILLAGRPSIRYDIASFDIGSTVAGLDLPGIRQHAVPTRPIGRFVSLLGERIAAARALGTRAPGSGDGGDGDSDGDGGPLRVVVVGGGAGGVEVAFTLERRLREEIGRPPEVLLTFAGPRLLEGFPASLGRRAARHAAARGIELAAERRVVAAGENTVRFDDGSEAPCDLLLWVTGAAAHPLFTDSGLACTERGYVLTRSTLQVRDDDDLFAVGDCATLEDYPATPKAGVYAVRQGPYLTDNLRAALAGGTLRRYRPQSDFLTLLNLGDGGALGAKAGFSFEGRWVMRLKDWIDRRFMRLFQLLDEDGRPLGDLHETMSSEGDGGAMAAMLCGGCAAKVGQSVLERALSRLPPAPSDPAVRLGLDAPDDAAVYSTAGGDLVVTSIDSFTAFTDDPYLVGRIAAINAVSDLYATGSRPRHALALITLPEGVGDREAEETLYQALAGARDALDPLEINLLGGHTTTGARMAAGFAVDGEATAGLLPQAELAPGHALLLTKPLGTGVLFYADMQGRARGPWIERALASMARSNAAAAEIARELGATAVTDITGFGLVGHLGEILRRAGLAAELDLAGLPILPGAIELFHQGLRSTFHADNERALEGIAISREAVHHRRLPLLFDPQTSGGLLLALPAERLAEAEERLRAAGDAAAIGRVTEPRRDGALIEVRAGGGEPITESGLWRRELEAARAGRRPGPPPETE